MEKYLREDIEMSNELAIIEKQTLDLLRQEWTVLKGYSTTNDEKASEIIKTAALCVMESDALQKAIRTEQGKISFIHSMKQALRAGLSLNPNEGKAALIPYGNKITYLPMKNGFIDKAMECKEVKSIRPKVVKKNDHFELWEDEKGSHYKFVPALTDRGPSIGYVTFLVEQNGNVHYSYMSKEEVEEHRDKYAASVNGPWKKSFDGMAKKTVTKELLRDLNINPVLSELVGIDDEIECKEIPQIIEKSSLEDLNQKIKDNAAIKPQELTQEDIKSFEAEEQGELLANE
jgi:phage RecT family recombinase